jgi:DNA-binding transcriptional ArsR family regulator
MGASKTQLFSDKQNEIALYAKVLGHPARVAILQYLYELNACMCKDMVEEIGLSQPTISQHLQELKKAGLIQGTIEGKQLCYCIDPRALEYMKTVMQGFLDSLKMDE